VRSAVLLALAAILAAPRAASAQFPLRVQVLEEDTRRPLVGALVSAIDGPVVAVQGAAAAAGSQAGSTVSGLVGSDGTALLRVPAAGTYRILVRRIGFQPFTSDTVRVTGTSSVLFTVVAPSLRLALATVRVTARRACDGEAMSPSSEAAPLWEEVRKALETALLSRRAAFVVTTGLSVERLLTEDNRLISEDTTAKGTAGARPFTSVDPGVLERGGYVQGGFRTSLTFNAPDELVLLSPGFVAAHCLSMMPNTRRSGDTTFVGLRFEARTNRQTSEIEGTMWVDSATSELRRVEYSYVRAPLPFSVPGLGGFVDFRRHGSGAWYVSEWKIRMPRWRTSNLDKTGVALAGFMEAAGWASVLRESRALPVNVVRVITGSVFDSLSGRDLTGTVVRIPALGRETTTDFLGRFRFDSVAIGGWDVVAEYPPLEGTGLVNVRGSAEVIDVERADVALAVPSIGTLWRRVCGGNAALLAAERAPGQAGAVTAPNGAFVTGVVRHGRTGSAIENAVVDVTWPEDVVRQSAQTRTDSTGRYLACVGNTVGVSVRATLDSVTSVPVYFGFAPARVARRDVVLADDAQADTVAESRVASDSLVRVAIAAGARAPLATGGATIAGIVRDPTGLAIGSARVRALGSGLEARVQGGRFVIRGLERGVHVLSFEAIGYERARRVVQVAAGDSAHADVRLGRLATLAAVNITERARVAALRAEIDQRVQVKSAYMADSLKLGKMVGTWVAFEVPNARVRMMGTAFTVEVSRVSFGRRGGGVIWCTPAVYIDDARSDMDKVNIMDKADIGLIEFFSRVANAPLKYTGTGMGSTAGGADGTCGVVLVWTKTFLRFTERVKR